MGLRRAHRSLIYWLSNRQDDSFIHPYTRPVHHSAIFIFVDWLAYSLANHGFCSISLYYTILYYNALYYTVLHCTLIYDRLLYYMILRCIVQRCIVLCVLTLTATFVGSFIDKFNGRFSRWAVDWPIHSLIWWLGKFIHSFIHSYVRPVLHATHGPFVSDSLIGWLVRWRIIDLEQDYNIK